MKDVKKKSLLQSLTRTLANVYRISFLTIFTLLLTLPLVLLTITVGLVGALWKYVASKLFVEPVTTPRQQKKDK